MVKVKLRTMIRVVSILNDRRTSENILLNLGLRMTEWINRGKRDSSALMSPEVRLVNFDFYVVRSDFVATEIRIQEVALGHLRVTGPWDLDHLAVENKAVVIRIGHDFVSVRFIKLNVAHELRSPHAIVVGVRVDLELLRLLVPGPAVARAVFMVSGGAVREAVELVDVELVDVTQRVDRRAIELRREGDVLRKEKPDVQARGGVVAFFDLVDFCA